MKKIVLLSLVSGSILMAGGYNIPTTSVNGVALSGANVAHTIGADAAYFNPANMAFMDDENNLEIDLTYIGLSATNFKGTIPLTGAIQYDTDAEKETSFAPAINFVSSKIGGYRIGLSILSPGGSTKRWEKAPAIYSAEEFSLKIVEINPTVAKKISEQISVAIGARVVYSSGVVKSSATVSRDMEGTSINYGYNVALSYKPSSDFDMALTYRSNVDLTLDGTAKLYYLTTLSYDGDATVSVPLPAMLRLALAHTLSSKTTIEFVYERNFWSAYEALDFEYTQDIGALKPSFDDPKAKDYKDVSAYRLGITQELDSMVLMAGVVYDESPVPENTLGFELPGANSLSISFGGRYQLNKDLDLGLSALYSMKEDRAVTNDSLTGEFTNTQALLVSAGIGYKF